VRYCGRQRVVDEGVDGAREDEEGAEAAQKCQLKKVEKREWKQAYEPDLGGRGMRRRSL
jgi:hypothetical protein